MVSMLKRQNATNGKDGADSAFSYWPSHGEGQQVGDSFIERPSWSDSATRRTGTKWHLHAALWCGVKWLSTESRLT
jgi:hypothetical protein